MAAIACILFVALVCTARCNPLGEATTVCESTPNVGLGLGPLAGLGLSLPPSLALQLLSQSLLPGLGTSNVGDTKSSIGLPVLSPYGVSLNAGASLPSQSPSTVYESSNNAVSPVSLPVNLPVNLPGLSLPCPKQLAALGLPLNAPGLPLNGFGSTLAGLGSPSNGVDSPVNGLGLSISSLGLPLNGIGLPMNGLGLPLNGLAYGLPVSSIAGLLNVPVL